MSDYISEEDLIKFYREWSATEIFPSLCFFLLFCVSIPLALWINEGTAIVVSMILMIFGPFLIVSYVSRKKQNKKLKFTKWEVVSQSRFKKKLNRNFNYVSVTFDSNVFKAVDKGIYVAYLRTLNEDEYVLSVYLEQTQKITPSAIQRITDTFNLKFEKSRSNGNDMLLLFKRTKNSPYLVTSWSYGFYPQNLSLQKIKNLYRQMKLFYQIND